MHSVWASDPNISFHRIPKDPSKRVEWLELLQIQEDSIKPSTQVSSGHFPGGDPSKSPSLTLGKRFASPLKQDSRAKRARLREDTFIPTARPLTIALPQVFCSKIATAGEQLETNYSVHELPGSSGMDPKACQLINQALLTRLELLESEKKMD